MFTQQSVNKIEYGSVPLKWIVLVHFRCTYLCISILLHNDICSLKLDFSLYLFKAHIEE